jgi:hypothetical protein
VDAFLAQVSAAFDRRSQIVLTGAGTDAVPPR